MPEPIQSVKIDQASADQHLFVLIKCSGRPTISIDISGPHGRRGMSVRIDGTPIFYVLLDVKELIHGVKYHGEKWEDEREAFREALALLEDSHA